MSERCCHVGMDAEDDHTWTTQCERVASHIHEGKFYCSTHAPDGAFHAPQFAYRLPDPIDPPHYNRFDIQPRDAINSWGLGYNLGSAVKYIARHEHKGAPIQDLKKAVDHLQDYIKRLEGQDG